jgi:predicted AlkP superfamily pyrophosphatase or phosphodiesterase
MEKTVFILVDGCGFDLAIENFGFMEHLVESGRCAKYKVMGELPSSSRPIYETLFTGLPVCEHGIVNSLVVRHSQEENLFRLCHQNNLVTAAAAYHWISELYVKAPFNPLTDRLQMEGDGIDHGIYYFDDSYPDSHVFSDGEFLRTRFAPDFLFVHSMNIDDAGHHRVLDPQRYQQKAMEMNVILSSFISIWMEAGYAIVLSADHGMNRYGFHGGNTIDQRTVPLYICSPTVKTGFFTDEPISQQLIAPLLCKLLTINEGREMQDLRSQKIEFLES